MIPDFVDLGIENMDRKGKDGPSLPKVRTGRCARTDLLETANCSGETLFGMQWLEGALCLCLMDL